MRVLMVAPAFPRHTPPTVDAPATSCVASPTPSSTAGRVFSFPPAALAKALLRVVGDPKLTARMGQDGRERAARLFSWESIARDHLALFGV
jgi:glycosyltransferase involved in cell wall biosynthesis